MARWALSSCCVFMNEIGGGLHKRIGRQGGEKIKLEAISLSLFLSFAAGYIVPYICGL